MKMAIESISCLVGYVRPHGGALDRGEVRAYVPDGTNVGCNYEDALNGTIMTFYFYRNSQPIEEEFEEALELVKNRNPGSKTADVTSASIEASKNFPYLAGGIEFKIATGQTIRSGLWMMEANGWRLKMRMTYADVNAAKIQDFGTLALRGQFDRIANAFVPQPNVDTSPGQDV